jgi:ubiquinone/menaquinone biosynthesis C-methylase UbiE
LACGQGFTGDFKAGAKVIGDLSKELIELAQKQSPKEIKYVVAPADKLGFLPAGSIDAILCVLAIQNMKNVPGVFQECARVLGAGGRMVFVLNHPAFRIPKRSSWGMDSEKKIQYRRIDEYISESESEIAMHPGALPELPSRSTILQFYFKAMHKAGLVVSRLEEWTSNKQSQPGPNAGAENKARKEFPLFLALEVIKL